MNFFDAHFHIVSLGLHLCNKDINDFSFAKENIQLLSDTLEKHFSLYTGEHFGKTNSTFSGFSCSLSEEEFFIQQKLVAILNQNPQIKILSSFGIHPQSPDFEKLNFLEEILKNDEIDAIGECGLDLFTPELKNNLDNQMKIFEKQILLAITYKKPLILHLRKSIDYIFKMLKENDNLKKVPRIIFHSWAFPPQMAQSLIKSGVNAYFSFGKNLTQKSKNALLCIKELPEKIGKERILYETDAPFGILTINENFPII